MAILGSLILLAFSVLLTYGQRLELQHKLKMEAFRNAMQKAYELNSSVSYTIKKDVRLFSLFAPFGVGQQSTVGASASVMWQKGAPGPMDTEKQVSYSFYQINDQIIGDPQTGLPRMAKQGDTGVDGSEGRTIEVPVSAWKEDRVVDDNYTAGADKTETASKITNTKYAGLNDVKAATKVHVRFDTSHAATYGERSLPEYVYEDGTYYYDGSTRRVAPIDAVTQGAYQNPDTGHIEYSKEKVGQPFRVQRTWETSN